MKELKGVKIGSSVRVDELGLKGKVKDFGVKKGTHYAKIIGYRGERINIKEFDVDLTKYGIKRTRLDKNVSESIDGVLRIKGVTRRNRMARNGEISAEISKTYSHLSVIRNHLHNSGDIGNDLELYYYSSPQGRMELDRRLAISGNAREYLDIRDKVDSQRYKDFRVDGIYDSQQGEYYNTNWSDEESGVMSYLDKGRMSDGLKHSLITYSYLWLKRLNVINQEAISVSTSGGFKILQLSLDNRRGYNHHMLDRLVNEEYINEKYGKKVSKDELIQLKKDYVGELYTNTLMSFNSVPKLENPIMTYRGTGLEEVRDLFKSEDDKETLINKLVSGYYNGKEIRNARINKLPESSSVVPSIALRFGNIVLEIKRRTITSPINVGAWGVGEAEVLTNPKRGYKVHGAYKKEIRKGKSFLIIQLEEK